MADGRFVHGGPGSHANVPRSLTVQLLLFRRAQSVDQMEFGVWPERSDPQQVDGDTNGDHNQQKSPPPDRHGVQGGEADGQPPRKGPPPKPDGAKKVEKPMVNHSAKIVRTFSRRGIPRPSR